MPYNRLMMVFLILIALQGCRQGNVSFRVGSAIQSNMVLQRDAIVPVWGKAPTGTEVMVEVSWSQSQYYNAADDFGQWFIKIPTPSAGGPHQMKVHAPDTTLILDNILVGEVWLWAGPESPEMPEILFEQHDEHPVRFFKVEGDGHASAQAFVGGQWSLSAQVNPAIERFARHLRDSLRIPLGIIDARLPATSIESWLSHGQLSGFKAAEKQLRDLPAALRNWHEKVENGSLNNSEIPAISAPPSIAFNGLIFPFVRYAIQGVVLNPLVTNPHNASEYSRMLPGMVADWRRRWSGTKFHFLYTQAPPMEGDESWDLPRLREGQMETQWLPNSAMVVMTDVSPSFYWQLADYFREAGDRLGLLALSQVYQQSPASAVTPWYRDYRITDDQIEISFHHPESGLVATGGALREFEIAGKNHSFLPATAIVKGNTIQVFRRGLQQPTAVRFAWSNAPRPNLFSRAGDPVSPFRTDEDTRDFQLETGN